MTNYTFFGKQISGRFTIPSGIVTVTLDTLHRLAVSIPELGILTTKSIGPVPRPGNPEPVYAQVSGRQFVNAVGLANPGCEEFAGELESFELPPDKFLLISIFGGSPDDFQKAATTLSKYADGFELNFSCPHAKGYGQEIGKVPQIAREYLAAVKAVTDKPTLCKLSPNVGDLSSLAGALIEEGADGFTVINTCGPIEHRHEITGTHALSNKSGGTSGPFVKDEALRCIRQVRGAVTESGRDLPIIGMGGIASAEDVKEYEDAGADFFGIGTALGGMSTADLGSFFQKIGVHEKCQLKLSPELMKFRKFTVERIDKPAADLRIIWSEEPFQCRAGQFVFVWLPDNFEKPFAPAFDEPNCLVVRDVGPFTHSLSELKVGDSFYMRGPYGVGFDEKPDPAPDTYCLIGGGTGIAPLLLLAKRLNEHTSADRIHVFLGGRSADQVYFQEEFQRFSTLHIATDDGALGHEGFVTGLLEEFLKSQPEQTYQFYNCGPEVMEKPAFDIERQFKRTGIQTSIERYMKCGVGICGICAMDGWRTCVDGPIMEEELLVDSEQFGNWHRQKTGELVKIG
ncbi:MAG: dihydroorotate dehydrogenase [Planctomycetota bacterium]|jgi:dihydroorotate dehydrogenase (NAD+) catalytic subunit|nr:dihydroorotate dehydrogenase [Planctomycetota bacterium]